MKKITLIFSLFLSAITILADEISFTASAPQAVVVGEQFKIVYTLNSSGKKLQVPDFASFNVLAGPSKSVSSSVTYVNGKHSSETTEQYAYVLQPTKEGTYNFAAAKITVDGQQYQSNALTIKVLPPDKASQAQNSQSQNQQTGGQITAENLFLRPTVSRTTCREQEAILLTYKIYVKNLELVNIGDVKFPELNGFLVQEIELPKEKQFSLENFNGVNYNTITLRQYLIFPQRTGTIEIDKMSCTGVVRVPRQQRIRSMFDSFFETYQDLNVPLSTRALKINVEPLPQPKPADFCGGVGTFSARANINATELNDNEAITITLKISGNGNLKMLKTPELKFPADFETYEPKVTNDFKTTAGGVTGTKTIEYLSIPRFGGNYEIPETKFSYFDTSSGTYKTLSVPAYQIKVNKTATNDANAPVSNFTNQEQVRLLASDIRYIATDNFELKKQPEPFAGTAKFWLFYLIPMLIAALALIFFRKQAKLNADTALLRNKKANKVARKRLKAAEKFLKTNNKSAFYDEILRALWGYLCDKLSLPLAELNRENVSQELTERNVQDADIQSFISLLDECEFARYAPAADEHAAMDRTFEHTVTIIEKLENSIKK